MRTRILGVCTLAVAVLVLGTATAADKPVATTIAIEDLDCPSCAKKVATKLKAVAGVAQVSCDTEKQVAVVSPKVGTAPSPKALWEAVEGAGFKPTKLSGPGGTFTAKPQS